MYRRRSTGRFFVVASHLHGAAGNLRGIARSLRAAKRYWRLRRRHSSGVPRNRPVGDLVQHEIAEIVDVQEIAHLLAGAAEADVLQPAIEAVGRDPDRPPRPGPPSPSATGPSAGRSDRSTKRMPYASPYSATISSAASFVMPYSERAPASGNASLMPNSEAPARTARRQREARLGFFESQAH